ncbi:MAG: ornithine carbamoyltransferase [Acidobacteriota bacterium]
MKDKDLISIGDLSEEDIEKIFMISEDVKKNPGKYRDALKDKILAMIFEKPSLRTRFTFDTGIFQMGGHGIYLGPDEIQLKRRESIYDVAKNLERWADLIMIRTFDHQNVVDLAKFADVPVINGLSDLLHPCQALTDYFTIKEKMKTFDDIKLAYIGDGNNVCHSLLLGAVKIGVNMSIATPKGYEPKKEIVQISSKETKKKNLKIEITNDPMNAIENADIVYTDTWISMGQEKEKETRQRIFRPYQVNSGLFKRAKKSAYFMHCLPAHRGEEVTDEVIDSKNSIVFDQAENRLHVQKAIMYLLLRG